jgi:hypothetical protein
MDGWDCFCDFCSAKFNPADVQIQKKLQEVTDKKNSVIQLREQQLIYQQQKERKEAEKKAAAAAAEKKAKQLERSKERKLRKSVCVCVRERESVCVCV